MSSSNRSQEQCDPQAAAAVTEKWPVVFVGHGAGPAFFMEGGMFSKADKNSESARFIKSFAEEFLRGKLGLTKTPKAVVIVSGHWESDSSEAVKVTSSANPGLLYDYYGFPEKTYAPHLTYPCKCDPALASEVADMLNAHGIEAELDSQRAYDHGVFIPLKLMYPDADVPVVQISLHASLAPSLHIELGKAIQSLRDKNVLIMGSGMVTHNMRSRERDTPQWATQFVNWVIDSLESDELSQDDRYKRFEHWEQAPYARDAHPREEHFVPLLVCLGASNGGPATTAHASWMGSFGLHSFVWK